MTSEPTLVVGATGFLGTEICRQLHAAGVPLRALVRKTADPRKRDVIASLGADVYPGDLKHAGSLAEACAGVSTVVSTASATISRQPEDDIDSVDRQGQLRLIDAAEGAGVKHFVFISVPPVDVDYALLRAKREVEERLRSSKMSWTILRPMNFMEAWLSPLLGFDPANGKARILGSGERPVSWVSIRDVARFAVAAVDSARLVGQVLLLGGPDALSYRDVIHIFEEQGAPPIEVEAVPEAALEAQLANASNPFEEAYAAIMLATARGLKVDPAPALEILPGRLCTVREYAKSILGDK
jgi:uncharacterized protein YbjT (DUF2867 family)